LAADVEDVVREAPRPKKAKKKKKRRADFEDEQPSFWRGFLITLLVLGGIGMVIGALGFVKPVMFDVLWWYGAVISFLGGVAVMGIAREEGIVQVLLIIVVPFYFLYFVITHWDEALKPFLLNVFGGVLVFLATVLTIVGNIKEIHDAIDHNDGIKMREFQFENGQFVPVPAQRGQPGPRGNEKDEDE
jgi:hypothetical protein